MNAILIDPTKKRITRVKLNPEDVAMSAKMLIDCRRVEVLDVSSSFHKHCLIVDEEGGLIDNECFQIWGLNHPVYGAALLLQAGRTRFADSQYTVKAIKRAVTFL